MNNIETLLGSENFPGMSSKVWAFVVPSRAFPNPAGEAPLFAFAKTGKAGVQAIRQGGRIAACEGGSDALGWFTQSAYQIPDGLILKLFAMVKRQGTPRVACMFLRSRADAALTRYAVDLTGYHKATVRQAWLEGRFDQLTLPEAREAGVRILPMHERQFELGAVGLMIRQTELSPQLRAASREEVRRVTNSEGKAVVIEQTRRKRMIDV